jgi:hypothetical protein
MENPDPGGDAAGTGECRSKDGLHRKTVQAVALGCHHLVGMAIIST